jgi:PHS family inorganic phosphate transporter-like MFS transporter
MQPLGQLFSQLVGLWVLLGYDHMYDLQSCTGPAACANHIDSIWRWVTGAGAIPAVVAIYYRFMIKDPGLYDLDVKDQGQLAIDNTEKLFPRFKSAPLEKVEIPQMQNLDETNKETHHVTSDQDEIRPAPFNMPRGGEELYQGSQQLSTTPEESTEDDPPLPRQFSREDIREYFWEEGNWRSLLGTSICWFMLDL